jgi:4-hydroxy-tetrahydrodipicolinate reductase
LIKIALLGYGKMGKAIHELAQTTYKDEFFVNLIIDQHNRAELTTAQLQQSDVVIEFTGPESAIENIRFCFEANVPVICGSTGWTKQLKAIQLEAIEKDKAFLYAPNYSIGVNIFFEINRQLAKIMDQHPTYDVEMEEIHHTEKKDAPSGTALFAAFDILHRIQRKDEWRNRLSDNKATLAIVSKREENVPGTHIVKYFNAVDEIEIKHTAKNRVGFASGALMASKWILNKKGAFTMEDVLGFND